MPIIDPQIFFGLGSLITSISALIWSLRRRSDK